MYRVFKTDAMKYSLNYIYKYTSMTNQFIPIRNLNSIKSTVALGTEFENQVIQQLGKIDIQLHSCGGPNDKGIDLQGEWNLPNCPIPIFVQCKNTKQSKPQYVREFIGVMGREYNNRNIDIHNVNNSAQHLPIGLLCVSSSINNSLLRESALSPYPLALIRIFNQSIKSLQPNYSLLRLYPELQFAFDLNNTDMPTIMYKDKIVLKSF